MNLDNETEALLNGLEKTTGNEKEEIIKQALESYAQQLGKNLIIQQGQVREQE